MKRAWWAVALVVAAGCLRRVPEGDMKEGPVTVYVGARVRTGDAAAPIAEAVAVQDGRIRQVGTRGEVLRAAGGDAFVQELPAGAVVVPGLVDAHAHLFGLGRALAVAQLRGMRAPVEAVERLRAAGNDARQGDWWVGRGWDQTEWAEEHRRFPDRRVLDEAFKEAPVFLSRVDGHAAWVNGKALRRAGITAKTPDPAGGRIERDEEGEPTGVLVDNAIDLVSKVMPPLTDAQHARRVQAALLRAVEVGLTAVHDAGMDLRTFRYLQNLDAAGRLPLRVYAMAAGGDDDWEQWVGLGTFKGRLLEMRSVKFLMDGALGSRGAALHAPYADDPGNDGLLLMSPEELEHRAAAFMARGFQVSVHAIGDRAATLAIEALAGAAAAPGDEGGRHRLEHAQVLRPEDLRRMGEFGFIASMQPTHARSDLRWAEARLGPVRVRHAYAWRSVLEAGVPLAFGSDFPVEDPEPLAGLYAARTRQDAEGFPEGGWFPQQRLSGDEALRAFTHGAAYAAFAEGERGVLAAGYAADFTVLSVDPVEDAPRALLGAKVLLTVVDGREVFRPRAP